MKPKYTKYKEIFTKTHYNQILNSLLKAARENQLITYKGNPYKTSSEFLSRYLTDLERVELYIESAERKENCQPRILYLTRLSFRSRGIKTPKQNLWELITFRPEMLKRVFQIERKRSCQLTCKRKV